MNIFEQFQSKAAQVRFRVEITRSTQTKPIGDDVRSVSPGDVVTVSEDDAGKLVSANAAKIVAVLDERGNADAADAAFLRELLNRPVNIEREPMPDEWQKLPRPFQDGWKELADIREKVAIRAEWARRSSGRRAVGERAVRMLGLLHAKAQDASEALREFDQRKLWGATREASAVVVAAYHDRAKIVNEIRETARAIFNIRVAALELDEWKVDELFHGSTLRRLVDRDAPQKTAPNLRQAFNAAGDREPLIDAPLEALSSYYRGIQADMPGLHALLKDLKTQLARAKKAVAGKVGLLA